MTAPIRTMPMLRTEADMVEAYRARIRELNISYATVDAISGLPDGYTAKLMSPKPMKGLGQKAIEGLNGALALAFVAAIDTAQVARVKGRWAPRKRGIDRKKLAALASRLSIGTEMELIPELRAQLELCERMKMLGKLGGKASGKRRMKTMGKRTRQRIAAHAARARWAKRSTGAAPPV